MKKLGTKITFGLIVLACLPSARVRAQVDLKAATYGSDAALPGTAPGTATSTLGPITVTQIYTNSTSTYTFNFITDASGVSNYIYYPISATNPDPFVVGGVYTGLSLTSAPFGTPANLEMTVPAGTVPAPTATGVTGMYSAVSEGALTTTSVLSDNYTLATALAPNDIEAVQFTFTAPITQTVTAVTGNVTITDASNGDKINFYRPTNGLSFVAGTNYTIDGFAFGYSTGTEIYDPNIIGTNAIPEPSTDALLGLGGLAAVFLARRRATGPRGCCG